MLDALLRLWAGVLAATAPIKLLLIVTSACLAVVAFCFFAWCACLGCGLWRRYTRGS